MNKKQKIFLISSLIVITLLLGLSAYFYFQENKKGHIGIAEDDIQISDNSIGFETIIYQDKEYEYNTDIKNIVIMGTDIADTIDEGSSVGHAGQVDAIFVLSLNTKNNDINILQLSRDTMIDVDIYDIDGEFYATEPGQLSLQYAYGDGHDVSCLLTTNKISELLNGIPIQAYFALNMDGLPKLSDLMGGIDITLNEDLLDLNPTYSSGTQVHLQGQEFEDFVRYRECETSGSNNARMRRHCLILKGMIEKFREIKNDNHELMNDTYNIAKPYINTNMQLKELEQLLDFEFNEDIINIKGEIVEDKNDQLFLDDEDLKHKIIDLFYVEN